MRRKIICAVFSLLASTQLSALEITEEDYGGIPHFIIKTRIATYYYDKFGGGFSSIVDRDGLDWIAYKPEPSDTFPASAASNYRGLPNFVHNSEDSGVGYPGRNKCVSIVLSKRAIKTIAKSGKWEWTWVFYENFAEVTMDRVDPENKYWFLYQGPIAGSYQPSNEYWGTNLGGPRFEANDFKKNDLIYGNWWWVYFGDKNIERIFFVSMKKQDVYLDTFSYLGNAENVADSEDGMVVFGFGRMMDSQPLLKDPDNKFIIGFIEHKVVNARQHNRAKTRIEKTIGFK